MRVIFSTEIQCQTAETANLQAADLSCSLTTSFNFPGGHWKLIPLNCLPSPPLISALHNKATNSRAHLEDNGSRVAGVPCALRGSGNPPAPPSDMIWWICQEKNKSNLMNPYREITFFFTLAWSEGREGLKREWELERGMPAGVYGPQKA